MCVLRVMADAMFNHWQMHRRRSIRLKGYDYSQPGAYFITICAQDRACIFGEIVDGQMRLSPAGEIVREEWYKTAAIRPNVELDEFVVMPNHIHGIILINDIGRDTSRRVPTMERFGKPTSNSIPTIVRLFKSVTTKRINQMRGTPAVPVWQRNYYEHIVRNDKEMDRIRQYVVNNPMQWYYDRENPENINIQSI